MMMLRELKFKKGGQEIANLKGGMDNVYTSLSV